MLNKVCFVNGGHILKRQCLFMTIKAFLPQCSWGKVMFLHVFVILSTGKGCGSRHPLLGTQPHPLASRHPPGRQTPFLGRHPPAWADTPAPFSGRYASYWNAFLFKLFVFPLIFSAVISAQMVSKPVQIHEMKIMKFSNCQGWK